MQTNHFLRVFTVTATAVFFQVMSLATYNETSAKLFIRILFVYFSSSFNCFLYLHSTFNLNFLVERTRDVKSWPDLI
jgi:hypothetical protein